MYLSHFIQDIPMKVYALASYQAQLTKYANFVF